MRSHDYFIKKRKHYFVKKHSEFVKNYHKNIIKSMKSLLAVMGLKNVKELNIEKLIFLDIDSIIHDDMHELFERRILKKKKKEDEPNAS